MSITSVVFFEVGTGRTPFPSIYACNEGHGALALSSFVTVFFVLVNANQASVFSSLETEAQTSERW